MNNQKSIMTDEVNIISIHEAIMAQFATDKNRLDEYKKKVQELENDITDNSDIIEINEIQKQIGIYKTKIHDIESQKKEALYLSSTVLYIEAFKKYTNQPIKLDFTSHKKPKKEPISESKTEIIENYLPIAEQYIDVSPFIIRKIKQLSSTPKDIICSCGRKMKHINDETVCSYCGIKSNEIESFTTYKDIDRVNISSNYQYDMRQHLKDHLDNYLGRQKTPIPKEVYETISKCIKSLDLPLHTVSIKQIKSFMKKHGYSKYYNDLNKIHHELTGEPLPRLDGIEELVIKDIDAISNIYHEVKKPGRKNFINAQLTICMLLLRRGHKCSISDFHSLRTLTRLKEHLDTYRKIEEKLNWSRTPLV